MPPPPPAGARPVSIAGAPKANKVTLDNCLTAIFSLPFVGILAALSLGVFFIGIPLSFLAFYLWDRGRRIPKIICGWRWFSWATFASLIVVGLLEWPQESGSKVFAVFSIALSGFGLARLLRLHRLRASK